MHIIEWKRVPVSGRLDRSDVTRGSFVKGGAEMDIRNKNFNPNYFLFNKIDFWITRTSFRSSCSFAVFNEVSMTSSFVILQLSERRRIVFPPRRLFNFFFFFFFSHSLLVFFPELLREDFIELFPIVDGVTPTSQSSIHLY